MSFIPKNPTILIENRKDMPVAMHTEGIAPIITKKSWVSRQSKRRWKKTSKLIANGVQTLSKRPDKFIEGVYPIYLEKGAGAWVYDGEDNAFIDYPLGLGAILLGHAYPEVSVAITRQACKGLTFTLPSDLETQLAEKLNKIIPCAEKVRFLKTGSDATTAAVRIARSYTKKMGIAYCGYHGWHDWFTANTPKNNGIPKFTAELAYKFEYNNLDSLHKILDTNDVGVVILEPYIYEAPKNHFLQKVIRLSHEHGALVIFDEVVTGFRTKGFSAQKMFRVTPDLACFGKAMANGMPISVVCGKAKYMNELEGDCFVSSTFGGELISIASALATIEVLEKEDAISTIWKNGIVLKDGYNAIAKDLEIDTSCEGYPCRTMFHFPTPEHKALFWQECIKEGVLFGYAQFISYSHDEYIINETLRTVLKALRIVKAHWSNPLKALHGRPPKEVFRLVVTKKGN